MHTPSLLLPVTILLVSTLAAPADAQTKAQAKSPVTFGGALGMTFTPYEADPANADYVGDLAIGFDMHTVVWFRPMLGVRGAAGVEFFKGPDGPDGHPAGGSFGLASIALATRTTGSKTLSFGVDVGASTTFESTYSYSYTSGNTIYVYPSTDLPLNAGPFAEVSLRKTTLVSWLVSYRHYFAGSDASNGRLKSRLLTALSISK
jgi:hypothetical protein